MLSLMGPWGAGKTSVLNLVESELGDRAEVLRFEPWLFSGAEQLVTRFFEELGAQLRTSKSATVRAVADRFVEYGEAVSPLVPLVFGRTGAAVVAVLQRRRAAVKGKVPSASGDRRELQRRLHGIDLPIVVFIDDIDRLTPHEVREVVRLVKLVGDLPGVRYLLAFDRRRVELALGDEAADGRAYLEKIVQAPHDLPVVNPIRLRRLALEELNQSLGGTDLPFFSQNAWGNLYAAGVAPMLGTLRDARRFANVAPAALQLTQDEVAAQDVLALEALRLFDPDVHSVLPELADVLTGSIGIDLRPSRRSTPRRAPVSLKRSNARSTRKPPANCCACSSRQPDICSVARGAVGGHGGHSAAWLAGAFSTSTCRQRWVRRPLPQRGFGRRWTPSDVRHTYDSCWRRRRGSSWPTCATG